MLSPIELVVVAIAALAAGAVNAAAGGGTLITFPTLTALGVPPVTANVTNAVALLPGYLGGALAQREDLRGERRVITLSAVAALGGLGGGALLLSTGEERFEAVVPYLILFASALLAVQGRVRARLITRSHEHPALSAALEPFGVFFGAIYGGYFGAGLGIILLAVLGLLSAEPLPRLNAMKQLLAFSANVAAALYFAFEAEVAWQAAVVMMVGSMVGGHVGGSLASRVTASTLRWTVVVVGVIVSLIYFLT